MGNCPESKLTQWHKNKQTNKTLSSFKWNFLPHKSVRDDNFHASRKQLHQVMDHCTILSVLPQKAEEGLSHKRWDQRDKWNRILVEQAKMDAIV